MKIEFSEEQGKYVYGEEIPEDWNKYYAESLLVYWNCFYEIFARAFDKCEFSSLLTIFGVKGLEDAGWNAYKSSLQIINTITLHNGTLKDGFTQRNLSLWIYGHVMEASKPYENIMNFLDIIIGEQYSIMKFPLKRNGSSPSPGEKIQHIVNKAESLGIESLRDIYGRLWDRNLRNAIFHSDYILYGNEVRIRSPFTIYSHEDINRLVNNALAYFQVIDNLRVMFISQYQEPKVIDVHPEFRTFENEKARVIVRKGYGAIGIKDNWTLRDLAMGKIPYRIGNFYPDEKKALDSDPLLATLPERES